MAKLNKIQIIGRFGKDPEMSFKGQNGDVAVTKVSVAAERKRDKETVDWFNVVAFGQTAEFINQYGMFAFKQCFNFFMRFFIDDSCG